MNPDTASAVQKQKLSLAEEVFRLKLEWITAKSDVDKRKMSEQIRKRFGILLAKS